MLSFPKILVAAASLALVSAQLEPIKILPACVQKCVEESAKIAGCELCVTSKPTAANATQRSLFFATNFQERHQVPVRLAHIHCADDAMCICDLPHGCRSPARGRIPEEAVQW